MRVVVLARTSTTEQTISIDAQVETMTKWCASNQHTIVEVITEHASGKSLDRVGLQRALATLYSDACDGLLTVKQDRLSRDTIQTLTLTNEIVARGKVLLFCDGSVEATPEGKFLHTLRASLAQMERENIAKRTSVALKQLQSEGKHVGRKPYGFSIKNGMLVRDEREQATILKATKLRKMGLSYAQVVSVLTRDHMIQRNGKPFSVSSLCNVVLKNYNKAA